MKWSCIKFLQGKVGYAEKIGSKSAEKVGGRKNTDVNNLSFIMDISLLHNGRTRSVKRSYKKLSYRRQRDSVSATRHVFLGLLTDRALHWTLHLLYN